LDADGHTLLWITPANPISTAVYDKLNYEFLLSRHPVFANQPSVGLYVAAILARRLDAANRWLVAVKRQLETGEPPSVIGKAVEKVEELLSYGGRDPSGW